MCCEALGGAIIPPNVIQILEEDGVHVYLLDTQALVGEGDNSALYERRGRSAEKIHTEVEACDNWGDVDGLIDWA